MGFLGFGNKKEVVEEKSFEGFRSINTEGQDLSQPFVDDYFNRNFTHVQFGENNLYPQILNQLYISAPMHQACSNFKKYTLVGSGYTWEGYDDLKVKDQISLKTWEKASNFKESFSAGALDWIKHGRVIALLHYDKTKEDYDKFVLVDPENIRNNLPHIFQPNPTKYFY